MSETYDREPDPFADEDPEPRELICRCCGSPHVYWQEVYDKEGFPKARLFEDGKPHVCNVADEFDSLEPTDA